MVKPHALYLTVKCPTCEADPGEPCKGVRVVERVACHQARVRLSSPKKPKKPRKK